MRKHCHQCRLWTVDLFVVIIIAFGRSRSLTYLVCALLNFNPSFLFFGGACSRLYYLFSYYHFYIVALVYNRISDVFANYLLVNCLFRIEIISALASDMISAQELQHRPQHDGQGFSIMVTYAEEGETIIPVLETGARESKYLYACREIVLARLPSDG